MSDPQVSQAHRQTGEIIPLIEGTPAPVALDEMRQMLGYVEEFVKSILKEKEDYAKVPGTDRNCLLQPGAEKIKFAFNLADEYTTLERYVEPDREWTYRTFDKRSQTEVERKARGYFRYEVRCDLVNRKTGVIWGACVGVCESSERGRKLHPPIRSSKWRKSAPWSAPPRVWRFCRAGSPAISRTCRGTRRPTMPTRTLCPMVARRQC